MSSIYKKYTLDQIEELQSNFLIDSWSYSKVTSFARNEKAFEMSYIFGLYSRKSASTIAGQAYHYALQHYFDNKKENKELDLVKLEMLAFNYIEEINANTWKLQKTTPTVDECKIKAIKTANALLKNFVSELSIYLDEIEEIIGVELVVNEYAVVNGVDIPIPCHGVIDLVVKTKDKKRVIIDHKSKSIFTDEEEIALSGGVQAITYVLAYEEKTGEKVDEVWFIENKYSKNKDNSAQLKCFKISIDENTKRLYEAMLYEPLKRMIEAVNNPDYVYLINNSDNFVDKAELYDFWARTMISEVDDFNVEESKKELVSKRLKKIRDASIASVSPTVIKKFKENASLFIQYDLSNKNMTQAEKIEHVLRTFGIITKVQHTFDGYSSSSYLLEMSAGTSISNVNKYRLDIANALDVSNVRINKDLFVYEGKSYLSIESGKKGSAILEWDKSKLEDNKIPIGIDNFGRNVIWDMDNQSTPHMLICGATGSGKSVSIKSTIEYALLSGVGEVFIFDPKHEFTSYRSNRNTTVVNEIEDIEEAMEALVKEMELRVKNKISKKTLIIFDEFADAVANSRKGKELDIIEEVQEGYYAPKKMKGVFGDIMSDPIPKMRMKVTGKRNSLEENLRILLQKGRSSGFRIIAATQRASTKVITGDAKVNFPVQICFRVPKDIDSIVVLDEPGAESLNGRGDGLIKSPEYFGTIRFQAFFKQ